VTFCIDDLHVMLSSNMSCVKIAVKAVFSFSWKHLKKNQHFNLLPALNAHVGKINFYVKFSYLKHCARNSQVRRSCKLSPLNVILQMFGYNLNLDMKVTLQD
jgi:hypothetical protein